MKEQLFIILEILCECVINVFYTKFLFGVASRSLKKYFKRKNLLVSLVIKMLPSVLCKLLNPVRFSEYI